MRSATVIEVPAGSEADNKVMSLDRLSTPALVLERGTLDRNIERLTARLQRLGVTLRPHLKTAKSRDVARRLFPHGYGPITVSTLKEAEYFAADGARDVVYAVGLAPHKIKRVLALRAQGVDLAVVIDTLTQAQALAASTRAFGQRLASYPTTPARQGRSMRSTTSSPELEKSMSSGRA
jgi:D-serine deaminase-like pyridoxal phosphate-dependent protein